jgi:hypothetical protein
MDETLCFSKCFTSIAIQSVEYMIENWFIFQSPKPNFVDMTCLVVEFHSEILHTSNMHHTHYGCDHPY